MIHSITMPKAILLLLAVLIGLSAYAQKKKIKIFGC